MNRLFSIHPLTWCVVAIAIVTGYFRDLILLFSLIVIHEMGHYVMARFFRWRVQRIVILPFGGVAEVDEHGNRPFKEEFLVTIAGPLQHVWMLAVGYFLYAFDLWSSSFYADFLIYNVMILTFNLLPFWPLDGGKLLFLLLTALRPFKKAHLLLLRMSLSFLFIFLLFSLLHFSLNLNVFIVVLFLLFSLYREWRHHPYVFMRFLLERHRLIQTDALKRRKTLFAAPDQFIGDVLKSFYKGVRHDIVVGRCKRGFSEMDERDLLDAYFNDEKTVNTVSDVIRLK